MPTIATIGIAAMRTQVSRLQGTRMPTDSRSIAADREAECLNGTAEVRRRFRFDLQLALARGMRQHEPAGMEVQTSGIGDGGQQRFLAAILAVAQDGTTDRRAVHAQLMRPSGAWPQRQKRPALAARSTMRKWVSAFWPFSGSTCINSRSPRAPGRLASGRSMAPSGLGGRPTTTAQ